MSELHPRFIQDEFRQAATLRDARLQAFVPRIRLHGTVNFDLTFKENNKKKSAYWCADSIFFFKDGKYVQNKTMTGQGISPYDPSHNSTSVFVGK